MNNDKFIAKWKPIHEKSLVRYCLKYLTKLFSFTSLITIIFLWIYPRIKNRTLSEDEMYFVLTGYGNYIFKFHSYENIKLV